MYQVSMIKSGGDWKILYSVYSIVGNITAIHALGSTVFNYVK